MVEPFKSSVEMDYDKMVYENKGWGQHMTGGGENEMKSAEMESAEMKSAEMKSAEMQYDEMVYNKEDDKIMAGGYSVNSLLLNEGMPAVYTGGKRHEKVSEKVSDRFKHLAIPAGLYLSTNYSNTSPTPNKTDDSVVDDDLYEKLLKLAEADNKIHRNEIKKPRKHTTSKKTTKKKKHKKSIKRKTKRK